MITGKVKMYDEKRGFGFIKRDDGAADVFLHVSAFEDDAPPLVGDRVEFLVEADRRGRTCAAEVRLIV